MKVSSERLANALSRARRVIGLSKITNPDYGRARFVVEPNRLTITTTDGYFVSEIWLDVEEPEPLDALVEVERLGPFAEYVQGEIDLSVEKNKIMAKCGRAQCSARTYEGWLPKPEIGDSVGTISISKEKIAALVEVADTNLNAADICGNISLVHDQWHCLGASNGTRALIVMLDNAYEVEERYADTHWLLPPKYMDAAVRIAGAEDYFLHLPNHVSAAGNHSRVVFPTVRATTLPVVVSEACHGQAEHIFLAGPIQEAIATIKKSSGERTFFSIEKLERDDLFVVRHPSSDFQSVPFSRYGGEGEFPMPAQFAVDYALSAIGLAGGSAEVHLTSHANLESYAMIVRGGSMHFYVMPVRVN